MTPRKAITKKKTSSEQKKDTIDISSLIEHGRFIIDRYDHYYESINTKGNLYLALNSILIGGLATGYPVLDQKFHFALEHNLLICSIIFFCAMSLGFTIFAINPFTRTGKSQKNASMIFFGQVAQKECDSYKSNFLLQSEQDILDDLLSQTHTLARGLCLKFTRLKWAGRFFFTGLLLLVLSTLFLIIKNSDLCDFMIRI